MAYKDDRYYMRTAWLWLAGWALFRLIWAGLFPLAPDEANYWQWGRHLAWGYHDQAPLMGWALWLSTSVLGHCEWSVRLPSVLAMWTASAYLVAMARRWSGTRTAVAVAFLTQGVLVFNVGGLLATPDALQAAGWAGAAYHTARAYENGKWAQWLTAGFWLGLGLLAKYTMIVFPAGAFAYGLFSSQHRVRLISPGPYVGLLLGLAMFCPVIYWNHENNWNSLRHVAHLGGTDQDFILQWRYLGDYVASQAALLSPLVFLLILLSWGTASMGTGVGGHWTQTYYLWTSFPMFAGFALLSLHTRVYGNWPAAGYLTASVLAATYFSQRTKRVFSTRPKERGKLWAWAVGTSYLLTLCVLLHVVWPVLPVPLQMDRTLTELSGWRELGEEAGALKEAMPQPSRTFLFGLRYQIASELAFYSPGRPRTVCINRWKRPNVYDYWWRDQDLLGWDAVGVTLSPDSHTTMLHEVFDRVDPPVALPVTRDLPFYRRKDGACPPIKTFYLYKAYGFRGGLRWKPPEGRDVRKVAQGS